MSDPVFTRADMRRALGAAIYALDKPHLVEGRDAEYWHGSYRLLTEALEAHLPAFIHDDDVAEEAIYIAAIESASKRLTELSSAAPTDQITKDDPS